AGRRRATRPPVVADVGRCDRQTHCRARPMTEPLAAWLALREPFDAAARSAALTQAMVASLPRGRTLRILDLATGTGANVRFLAPRLPAPQQWLLVDADPDLLAEIPSRTSALADVQIEVRQMNLGPLDQPDIFTGRDFVTASALLDLVSEQWLTRLAD